MQKGQIFRKGSSWFVRYWDTVIEKGVPTRVRVCQRIAPFCDLYRSKASVRPLAEEILGPLNAGKVRPESTQTVANFIENVYLPYCKEHKRPSTYGGYGAIFKEDLKNQLLDIRLRDFRCFEGDRLLALIAARASLSHNSLRHLKSFLSGAFTFAKRQGILDDHNPMDGVSIPKGEASRGTMAYSLEDVQAIVRALHDPAKSVVVVAAFMGLRRSELRGLRWEDFSGDELRVARTVWRSHISEPKTRASKAAVPVIPIVKNALTQHQARCGCEGFIFLAKNGSPMDLHNLERRVIIPALKLCAVCGDSESSHIADEQIPP